MWAWASSDSFARSAASTSARLRPLAARRDAVSSAASFGLAVALCWSSRASAAFIASCASKRFSRSGAMPAQSEKKA